MGDDLALTPGAAARRALELAESDPDRAIELVERHAARLPADGAAVATLARGLALQRMGSRRAAGAALREADRLLPGAGLPVEAARARVALALEVLDAGDTAGALALLADAGQGLRGAPAARVAMQRALVLQRSGRVADTLDDWTRALRAFHRSGDRAAAARAQGNRGLVHTYRGEFRAADSDLKAAERSFAALGDLIGVAEAVHNQGFLAIRRGDLPTGLRLFDDAQQGLGALGVARPEMLVDRAETLLAAGVAPEARDVAEAAVAALEQAGREADRAEALLLVSQACEEAGDAAGAARSARAARELFRRQGRPRWELLAAYREVRADAAGGGLDPAEVVPRLSAVAEELAAAGWRPAAVEADALAVDLACRGGSPGRAAASRGRLARARRRCLPAGRLAAWLAEARYRLAAEGGRGVERALRAALDAAHDHQSGLGSLELRTRLADKAAGIVSVGVRHAAATGRADRALHWMEAARLIQVPGQAAVEDPDAAAALETLRTTVFQAERETDPVALRRLRRQEKALEEVVRRRSRYARSVGTASAVPEPPAAVVRAVGERMLVEFGRDGEDLVALTVSAGDISLHRLAPLTDVRRSVAALRLALQARMVPETDRPGAPDPARASRALEEILVHPLLARAPGLPLVVVVPTGALASVPWGALGGLAELDVVLAPSASAWVRAQDKWRPVGSSARVLSLSGPGLAQTEREARAVAALWRNTTVLAGDDATVERAVEEIGRAEVLHVAAHGQFRADNPLLSSIRLADGPLTLYEMTQLRSLPRLVVLSACNAGRSDAESTGLLGMSVGLQRAGVQSVVSSVTPVHDDDSPELMSRLHGLLRSGSNPGSAVRGLNHMAQAQFSGRSRGFVVFSAR